MSLEKIFLYIVFFIITFIFFMAVVVCFNYIKNLAIKRDSVFQNDDNTQESAEEEDCSAQHENSSAACEKNALERFISAVHPFLGRFAEGEGLRSCAESVLRFAGIDDNLAVYPEEESVTFRFDLGYIRRWIDEKSSGIRYVYSEQESYHDGGGSSWHEWTLTEAVRDDFFGDIREGSEYNGCKLPPCRRFCSNGERVLLEGLTAFLIITVIIRSDTVITIRKNQEK